MPEEINPYTLSHKDLVDILVQITQEAGNDKGDISKSPLRRRVEYLKGVIRSKMDGQSCHLKPDDKVVFDGTEPISDDYRHFPPIQPGEHRAIEEVWYVGYADWRIVFVGTIRRFCKTPLYKITSFRRVNTP